MSGDPVPSRMHALTRIEDIPFCWITVFVFGIAGSQLVSNCIWILVAESTQGLRNAFMVFT